MTTPRLRAPIVLVHGLLGYDRVRLGPIGWEYFRGIRASLEEAGNRVLVPRLSMTAGVAVRAEQLRRFLLANAREQPVHILAHSMGGLDARFLISKLGMAERVLSLTTLGTPHRGAAFAEWGLRRFHAVLRPFFDVVGVPYRAFLDLTPKACALMNEQAPDAPGVRYFSVAGRCEGPWLTLPWRLPHAIVLREEGANDGIVAIASASYGEAMEIWDGDHLNLINFPNAPAIRRGLWVDRRILYGKLLQRLADCGF